MKKVLIVVISVIAILVVLGIVGLIVLAVHTVSYYDDSEVYGDVTLLAEEISVDDIVPIVFVVPDKYSDLHKEMWDCYKKEGDELIPKNEYILEWHEIAETFTQEEIEELFKNSPFSIYEQDKAIISKYTPRLAVFIPKEAGDYVISVWGYYRSTSPQGYGSLEVRVNE